MRVYVLVLSLSLLAAPVHAKCPADATTASFLAPGRFGVAMRDLTLVDTSRTTDAHGTVPAQPSRTLVTTVWYPTAPGAADGALAPGAPFPLVVSSHGFSDLRLGAIYLATALASRGYVVAAPDFPLTRFGTQPAPVLPDVRNQPADVSFVIDQLLERSRTRGEWLAGGVDRHRIGVSGLSLGGLTTLLLAYHPQLRDPRVRAAVALAPAACYLAADFYRTARPPLLLVNGDQDAITPLDTNATRVFGLSRSPRQLLTLAGATHTAFSGLITGPPTANYDTAIGCPFVEQLTQADVDAAVAAFGAAGANLVDSTGCALPCTGPAPTGATMAATRQHDLTRAAVTAFFESTLRRSRAARCFLGRGLAAENADVASALAPRRRLKGP
jgi:predicted dienelactone hydrolase